MASDNGQTVSGNRRDARARLKKTQQLVDEYCRQGGSISDNVVEFLGYLKREADK